MNTDKRVCMIVSASVVELARAMADVVAPSTGTHYYRSPLEPEAGGPVSHYITEGWIDGPVADVLLARDPALLHAALTSYGGAFTLAECEAVTTGSDVSTDDPFSAMARLGLRMAVVS